MARLRRAMASGSVLNPIACSASPGTGSTRDTDPSATIRWSYAMVSATPDGVSMLSSRALGAAPVTRARRTLVQPRYSRSGTTTCRGSSDPAAAPGSSGVYRR